MKENLCINPGLNDGAVPQGITVDIERDIVLTTAYMADHSSSRIYVTNSKNESRYIVLSKNGKEYKGHVGGISLSKDYAYVAEGDTIFPIKSPQLARLRFSPALLWDASLTPQSFSAVCSSLLTTSLHRLLPV